MSFTSTERLDADSEEYFEEPESPLVKRPRRRAEKFEEEVEEVEEEEEEPQPSPSSQTRRRPARNSNVRFT